jgi:hypothetical protein
VPCDVVRTWFFTHIFTGDFNFKGLTARRIYKSFGVKGIMQHNMTSARDY